MTQVITAALCHGHSLTSCLSTGWMLRVTLECASGEGWVRMERSTDCDSPIIVITATQGHGAGVGNVSNAPITGPNTQITLGGAGCRG